MTRDILLTLQSDMCGQNLDEVLDFHDEHGLHHLDAKTGLRGEPVEAMTPSTAQTFAHRVASRGMATYALSTSLFEVPGGDREAIRAAGRRLVAMLPVIETVSPRYVRVLAPRDSESDPLIFADEIAACGEVLSASGAEILVENGPYRSAIDSPDAAARLYRAVCRVTDRVHLIWDVQNMWQCGWFPHGDELTVLADAVRYVHVKGGRTADGSSAGPLVWASTLTTASWPVQGLLASLLASPHVEALALNPSHGALPAGETPAGIRDHDIDYLRTSMAGVPAIAESRHG